MDYTFHISTCFCWFLANRNDWFNERRRWSALGPNQNRISATVMLAYKKLMMPTPRKERKLPRCQNNERAGISWVFFLSSEMSINNLSGDNSIWPQLSKSCYIVSLEITLGYIATGRQCVKCVSVSQRPLHYSLQYVSQTHGKLKANITRHYTTEIFTEHIWWTYQMTVT